jgi:hypothetical protein
MEFDSLPAGCGLLSCEREAFRANFDRVAFEFGHRLHEQPAFDMARLIDLARSKARSDLYYNTGDVRVEQPWSSLPMGRLSTAEIVERLEQSNAWVIIRRANEHDDFRALLSDCTDEIEAMLGQPLRPRIDRLKFSVILSSPSRVTNYHMDGDCNFLFQIRGSKTLYVFDRNDRATLSDLELEDFWSGDLNAAKYRQERQDRARAFDLRPGKVVHIPVTSPHWVVNGPEISVSVSMNFVFRDNTVPDVYRWNHVLRRIGLSPRPPGRSPVRDMAKHLAVSGARGLSHLMKGREKSH